MALRGVAVVPAHCGDFSGFYACDVAYGEQWRQWFLFAGAVPLGCVYRSDPAVAGRDDADVDAMLRTLRARPGGYRIRRGLAVLAKALGRDR